MTSAPTRILNVNDSPVSRRVLTIMLRQDGYEVVEAGGGREALEKASTHPDLILLDVQMPDIDGYAVVQQLKAKAATRSIPIVMISASYTSEDKRVEGLERGADGYLTFPVERRVLTATVRSYLRMHRAEQELQQAQKLESIGRLAAGIAHEINTPTQYIGDNIRFLHDAFVSLQKVLAQDQLLLEAARRGGSLAQAVAAADRAMLEEDLAYLVQEIPKAIAQSQDGVERVTQIVGAVREFSHPSKEEKAPVDLTRAITSTLTISRNEWKFVADAVTDFDPELPLVPCLPGEFNQVILNLVINAAHAIAEKVGDGGKDKGTITVSAWRDGDWVEVRVRDTGAGIPTRVRDKIFTPFFTTKAVGKGTGQGLALARAVVVEKHAGTITFETEEGVGTCFVIRLPLVPATTVEPATA